MNTVTGYQGGSEIDIAVERGEIVCRGMDIPPHFGREPFDGWHKCGFDRHILQSGPKCDPRMGDAPTLFELMDQFKTPEVMRGVARVILASGDFGRPMVAGPGNPPERIKIHARRLCQARCATRARRGSEKESNGYGIHARGRTSGADEGIIESTA